MDEHAIRSIETAFDTFAEELENVRTLARKIRDGIERIDPFLQDANQHICPGCRNVCCISKHGVYSREDRVYLRALDVTPPAAVAASHETDPCPYLGADGCSIERWRRPSGCTWYFCDPLLDYIEARPGYREFDEALREVAELWLAMVEEFERISTRGPKRGQATPFSAS